MTDKPTNAEVEAMIHAVIDSKNILKIIFENENIKVIVQNMDEKIISQCKEQIKEILSPLLLTSSEILIEKTK